VQRGVYARSLQRLGHARWFALLVKHAVSKFDRAVYKASGGRLSASGSSLPTMLLTTARARPERGRRTDLLRRPLQRAASASATRAASARLKA
jgi:hypothetical protein